MHTVIDLWNTFYAAATRPIVMISHLTFVVSITVVFASAAIAWTAALWQHLPATATPVDLPPLYAHLWRKLYAACARVARVSLVHLRADVAYDDLIDVLVAVVLGVCLAIALAR